MSDQENSWSWGWRLSGALLGCVLLVVLSASVSGCGGSDSEEVSAAKARPPAPCQMGKPVAPHVSEAPASWTSGPRPAIALTCEPDKVDIGTAIVGYPTPGGGSCVSVYVAPLREVLGELCEPDGTRWTSQCERPGCVHYFQHRAESTVLMGPVPIGVSGVWAGIGGKQVLEGVLLTSVHGKRLRAMGAKEPFGFFSVYLPRCVEPDEVKIHLVAGGDEQIGLADGWDVSEPPCPKGSAERSS